MFSKEESKKLRQDFWTAFGKSYPRKWILYNTKIKGLQFKFHFDLKKALVSLDVETDDLEKRIALWEKLLILKSILHAEAFLPEAIFDDSYLMKNGKEISRVFVEKVGVSIHNKNSWRETMVFLNLHMEKFEDFFEDYKMVLDV